jgi:uncharacterized RDD family membrane protein YckC
MDTMPQSSNRYAPPAAHVEDVSQAEGSIQLAGRGARLGGVMIDTGLLMGLFWVLSRLTPWNAFDPHATYVHTVANSLAGVVLFMLVNGVLLARRGQTLGKMLVKVRIVRPDGSPAAAGRVLGLRYGLGWLVNLVPMPVPMIYGIVDCLLVFGGARRCLHDRIADTIVVKA